jgi:hypothetical protein
MSKITLKAIAVAVLTATAALSLAAPAQAGGGYYGHDGGGNAVGAGIIGFGIGALVGTALAPREVYVAPPPPPPEYYGSAAYGPAYGPPAWTPEWYTYCAQRYRSFNSRTGYFIGYDGLPYFCQ